MIARRPGALVFKALSLVREYYWTIRNRLILRLIWTLGSGVSFRGPVVVRSASGTVRVGRGARFGPWVNVEAARGAVLEIGEGVSINQGTFIVARESIMIGAFTLVGEYVSIRDNDHGFANPDELIAHQGYITRPVRIGRDVWIGRGAVISKGVIIGDGAVVGAGAVVTADVDEYTIVVGVPARLLRRREREPSR